MTTPSKAKTWVAAVGGLLAVLVPVILQLATYLPPQWSAVIGAVIAILTAVGVYHAPYTPAPPASTPTPPTQPGTW